MSYLETEDFLKANNLTKSDMDKIWAENAKTNWKVQNLIECGKHWSELNRAALESLPDVKRWRCKPNV